MASITYPHIEFDSTGVPILTGTRTKVVEIVLDRLAYHWDADEIQRQHPHLSLAQIYAALVFYHDHQKEMDQDIQARMQKVEHIKATQRDSAVRLKLSGHHRCSIGS